MNRDENIEYLLRELKINNDAIRHQDKIIEELKFELRVLSSAGLKSPVFSIEEDEND